MLKKHRTALAGAAVALALAASPAAAEKPELTIYTYESFASEWGPGPQIKAEFEKTCECAVTFVGLDTSLGVLGRIRLEGAGSKADIALGLDTGYTEQARNTGLFEAHGLDLSGKLALPDDIGAWRDKEFVPFDWGYFAFVYDETRLQNPPSSFRELIDSDAKIVIQDARTATPGTGLVLWVNAAYGNEAPEIWQGLQPRIVTVTKGWWDSYSMFLEGEADMVLSYTTSPAYHLIAEGKDNYAAAAFDEGHYTQIEVAGILKSSKNKQLARDFLAALVEPAMQSLLPTTNWMYPVGRSATLPDGFETLIQPEKSLLFSPGEVLENRKGWVDAWLKGLGQ